MKILIEDPKEPFKSDGCSGLQWLGKLIWFRHCCKDHDYAHWAGHPEIEGDNKFQNCIATSSPHLGPMKFVFAGFIVSGMATLRPIYRRYQILKKTLSSDKKQL